MVNNFDLIEINKKSYLKLTLMKNKAEELKYIQKK